MIHAKKLSTLAAVAAVAVGMSALAPTTASASTIQVGAANAILTCVGDCLGQVEGFVAQGGSLNVSLGNVNNIANLPAPGTLSETLATLFSFNPNNEASEVKVLNALAGTSFAATDASIKWDADEGEIDPTDFSFTSKYFAIKTGAGTAFFENVGGGALSLSWGTVAGGGGGLSHLTQIWVFEAPPIDIDPDPSAAPIPLPAAGWLLIGGLGALAAVRRRRKSV